MKKKIDIKLLLSIVVVIGILAMFLGFYINNTKNGQTSGNAESTQNKELTKQEILDNIYPHGLQSGIDKTMESWKETESDITGMTMYEKYEMGLTPEAGSDTDMDGLTDKEEIEVYGSDPLAYSTAGDLYSDGYKAEHGMDLLTKAEGGEDREFPYNKCENITLTAKTAMDFNANVKEVTGEHSLGDAIIYAEYDFALFTGDIEIDLSEVLDVGVTTSDISVYIMDIYAKDNNPYEIKFEKLSDTVIKITKERKTDHYYLFITSKIDLVSKLFGGLAVDNEYIDTSNVYLVETSPLLNILGFNTTTIYTNVADTQSLEENISLTWNGFANVSYKLLRWTREDVIKRYQFIEHFPFISSMRQDKQNILSRSIYTYYLVYEDKYVILGDKLATYGTVYNVVDADDSDNNSGNDTIALTEEFTIGYDTFPFENFATTYSDGNCAGLCFAMANTYNSNGLGAVSEGSYADFTWNLNEEEELNSLLSRGLADYKDALYFEENYGLTIDLANPLSNADDQFLNFISAYQTLVNDDHRSYKQYGDYIYYDMIENMMEILDDGKVLEVGIYSTGGISHMMICYDYEVDEQTGDVKLKMMDNNYTNSVGHEEYDPDLTIYVKKVVIDGTSYFTFEYEPMKKYWDSDYFATSDIGEDGIYTFDAYLSIGDNRVYIPPKGENIYN